MPQFSAKCKKCGKTYSMNESDIQQLTRVEIMLCVKEGLDFPNMVKVKCAYCLQESLVPRSHLIKVVYKETEQTGGNTYKVYTALSKKDAIDFLRELEVKEERLYIIVETPEGNYGKDFIMIFNEQTQEKIEFGTRKPLEKYHLSVTHCAGCGYPVLPAKSFPEYVTDVLITPEDLKYKGMGFYCANCKTVWCAICGKDNELKNCKICGRVMDFYWD